MFKKTSFRKYLLNHIDEHFQALGHEDYDDDDFNDLLEDAESYLAKIGGVIDIWPDSLKYQVAYAWMEGWISGYNSCLDDDDDDDDYDEFEPVPSDPLIEKEI